MDTTKHEALKGASSGVSLCCSRRFDSEGGEMRWASKKKPDEKVMKSAMGSVRSSLSH